MGCLVTITDPMAGLYDYANIYAFFSTIVLYSTIFWVQNVMLVLKDELVTRYRTNTHVCFSFQIANIPLYRLWVVYGTWSETSTHRADTTAGKKDRTQTGR